MTKRIKKPETLASLKQRLAPILENIHNAITLDELHLALRMLVLVCRKKGFSPDQVVDRSKLKCFGGELPKGCLSCNSIQVLFQWKGKIHLCLRRNYAETVRKLCAQGDPTVTVDEAMEAMGLVLDCYWAPTLESYVEAEGKLCAFNSFVALEAVGVQDDFVPFRGRIAA